MYAESIVSERLGIASETLGFPLVYHTTYEIDEFEKRLEQRYAESYEQARAAAQGSDDPAKSFQINITRLLNSPSSPKLTREEVRFMQNERMLVVCDAAYFMTRYYWILNRENYRSRFTFQAGQRILFEVIGEMESKRIAIEILLAKARQLGMSTLAGGLELLKVMFSDGVGGVVASADRDKTKEMASKIFYAYDKLPWWLRPLTSRRVESDQGIISFSGIDSKIIFQHGKQTNPIAMGSTPVSYHLSECSAYPDPENLIEIGLFKCVHPSPRVLGILESTCKGNTGWWHDTYWNSKSGWRRGESRLMALFLPFYCGTDMYPNETWLRKSPVPVDWAPSVETRKMIAESELYVHSNEILEKVLRNISGQSGAWMLPKGQAWYWEQNFKEHQRKGQAKTWFQEMPHSDFAAFQGSYDNVFGRETIELVYSERKTAYSVYGIVGQSIEDRHEPDRSELDYGERIIPVAYHSRKGETYRWELLPLAWEESFDNLSEIRENDSHMDKLFVWLPPEPGYDYSIGVDTSGGTGRDQFVVAVSRRGRTNQERDEQAAEFRSTQINHVEAYTFVMAIAAYFARYMEDTSPHSEPYVAIEQIAAVGDTCQLQMRKMGYMRFHQMIRYDGKPKAMRKANATRSGWFTSGWSRPMLTDGFVTLVKNEWYKVNSPWTMDEMDHWEVHYTAGGKAKSEHHQDHNDDGIFANAMAAFCPNDTRTMADRSKKQFMRNEPGKLPELDIQPTGGIVMRADGHGVMGREEILEGFRR